MSAPNPYDELARMAAGLAHPTRLRILNMVFQGEKAIDELAQQLGESPANTAAHVKNLRAAGLVEARKQGKHVILTASDEVLRLFMVLRETNEALSPTARLLAADGDDASDVTIDELASGEVVRGVALVDLRPESEFEAGHLPGAKSFPLGLLEARLAELPKRRRILVYCRGTYCPNARAGTRFLRERGFRADRLRFGVPEWRAAGLALEQEAP